MAFETCSPITQMQRLRTHQSRGIPGVATQLIRLLRERVNGHIGQCAAHIRMRNTLLVRCRSMEIVEEGVDDMSQDGDRRGILVS